MKASEGNGDCQWWRLPVPAALSWSFGGTTIATLRFENMQPKTSRDFLKVAEQRLNAAETLLEELRTCVEIHDWLKGQLS